MVWPIRISSEVTPRISAYVVAGNSRKETAPSTPNGFAKRIGLPSPLYFSPRFQRRGLALSGWWKDAMAERFPPTPTIARKRSRCSWSGPIERECRNNKLRSYLQPGGAHTIIGPGLGVLRNVRAIDPRCRGASQGVVAAGWDARLKSR